MVVMKGWPATLARTLRSFRTCSTCLRRMTGRVSSCKGAYPGTMSRGACRIEMETYHRLCAGSSVQTLCSRRPPLRPSIAPATRAQMYLTYSQRPVLCLAAWTSMRTRAQRLDQLKVFLAQDLGGVADGLLLRINVNLIRAECVLLRLPLRQLLLLFLARPVHGGIGAVV